MSVNRIEATAGISQVMDDFYAQIRGYDKVAWCMGPVPYEVMFCAGVGCFLAENTATRIAAAHEQDKYMDTSKAAGLGIECCSYAKINIGQALLMEQGAEIAERFRLPKPDFIALGDACPSMMQWARCLGEIFDVPVFVFDMPFCETDTDEEIKEILEYYKKRLAEFITFLEGVTGKPFDMELLKQRCATISEMTLWRKQMFELQKAVPAPASFIDGAVVMGPSLTIRTEAAKDLYKKFVEEQMYRVAHGIGVSNNEQYRIMWKGNFPWYKVGALSRLFDKYNAVIVDGCYGFLKDCELPGKVFPPFGLPPADDPLMHVACDYAVSAYSMGFDPKYDLQCKTFIKDFSIDAVIIHSPHTCRPWGMGSFDMARRIEDEYHIPCIVLELDHTDESYYNDAQVETRIQALLEAVDANRAKMGKMR